VVNSTKLNFDKEPPKDFKFVQPSQSLFQRYKVILFVVLLFELLFILFTVTNNSISTSSVYTLALPIVIFAIAFILDNLESNYDGWHLKNDRIILFSNKLFIRKKRIEIQFTNLQNVEYNPPGRWGHSIIFKTKTIEIIVLKPTISEFISAYILKHLNMKGIPIRFRQSDKEIKLYVQGKVDHLRIKSDKHNPNK
jgi:hypothetical protein